jgi:undecaprenyl-diphosphatase
VDFIQAVVLGIIQGVAEWLPISSSGHLVIAEHFLGVTQPLIFDVIIQLASVLVVIVVFWKDIIEIAKGVFRFEKKYLMLLLYIIVATIPVALVGFVFHDAIEGIFKDLRTVSFCLLITAFLLFLSKYPKKKDKGFDTKAAVGMGLAQAVAILPGVSRSGSTISAGMMLGFKRDEVARFSFLMFIPAMIGAAALEIYKGALSQLVDPGMVLVSALIAVVAGFFSLKLLLRMIKKDLFSYFGIYCAIVGLALLAYSFF